MTSFQLCRNKGVEGQQNKVNHISLLTNEGYQCFTVLSSAYISPTTVSLSLLRLYNLGSTLLFWILVSKSTVNIERPSKFLTIFWNHFMQIQWHNTYIIRHDNMKLPTSDMFHFTQVPIPCQPRTWMSVFCECLCCRLWGSFRRAARPSREIVPSVVCLSVKLKPR